MVAPHGPRSLSKGQNIGLADLDATLGSVAVRLETGVVTGRFGKVDISALPLGEPGTVRSDEDIVFYNQPSALDGAIQLEDQAAVHETTESEPLAEQALAIQLGEIPETVERVVLCASLDADTEVTFGSAEFLRMVLSRAADDAALAVFPITDAGSETALLCGELYRRRGTWRLRAIGQGYDGGLAAVLTAFGLEVAAEHDPPPTGDDLLDNSQGTTEALGSGHGADGSAGGSAPPGSESRDAPPPAMPAGWRNGHRGHQTDGDSYWQLARLFPAVRMRSGGEKEQRASSTLMAVTSTVREFGRALVTRCGGPAGVIETFTEVPFRLGEQWHRPDGVIRAAHGSRSWVALVEVKTAQGTLNRTQVENYIDIAQRRGFDAIITISNQLTGAGQDHPLTIDRTKLKKVALHHLSWDDIRAEATLLTDFAGVTDPTQQHVLDEFLRYLNDPNSGLDGFTDMGKYWVRVRDGVKAKTLLPTDRGAQEISDRFDQLVTHLSLHLSGLLGVRVRSIPWGEAAATLTLGSSPTRACCAGSCRFRGRSTP